jgi:NitT/TauT family transport system substrate-binding protein
VASQVPLPQQAPQSAVQVRHVSPTPGSQTASPQHVPQSSVQRSHASPSPLSQVPSPQQLPQSMAQPAQLSLASQMPSPQMTQPPQSAGQLPQNSPRAGSQAPSPQQAPQSLGQVAHDSAAWQLPSSHVAGQAPQSVSQLAHVSAGTTQTPSPHSTHTPQSRSQESQSSVAPSQAPSPQQAPQSLAQAAQVSPPAVSQAASPQQGPQSLAHEPQVSPSVPSHVPSPQQDRQSAGQLVQLSPPGPSQVPSPHASLPPSPVPASPVPASARMGPHRIVAGAQTSPGSQSAFVSQRSPTPPPEQRQPPARATASASAARTACVRSSLPLMVPPPRGGAVQGRYRPPGASKTRQPSGADRGGWARRRGRNPALSPARAALSGRGARGSFDRPRHPPRPRKDPAMADETAGKSRAAFYVVGGILAVGLVAFAIWRADLFAPEAKKDGTADINPDDLAKIKNPGGVEAADVNVPTTVKEYAYVTEEKLPPVAGVSSYSAMKDNTVRFALNVWAGWAPIVYANEGFAPGKKWKAADGSEFKVELVLIDDPVAMRDAYAAGKVHIGWGTLDMVPLFMEELSKDSRLMPRIFQQIDWSNGGDGIVARGDVKSINDLKGKTIVLAQNSPSQFFILNALISAGIQPKDVTFKYTTTAFEAAAAFNADKSISACVSWAPDIYKLTEPGTGNTLLVTTATANHLIADVWYARADFAKDHMPIVEGIVRGIFDAADALKADDAKKKVSEWMGKGYAMPAADALGMLGDAHWTNYAENRDFFMNMSNPSNFERTWDTAYYLYERVGKISKKTPFDQVMDFSLLTKLGKEPKYADSVNEYLVKFTPKSVSAIKAESGEVLVNTVRIHFYPNSWDLYKKITRVVGTKSVEEPYDPNVDAVLEGAAKLAATYGAARIVIEGHTDGSMKGSIPFEDVRVLSENRANAVKEALVAKYKLDPNKFSVEGMGWNVPAEKDDPGNSALNRRVEIKVYPLEGM